MRNKVVCQARKAVPFLSILFFAICHKISLSSPFYPIHSLFVFYLFFAVPNCPIPFFCLAESTVSHSMVHIADIRNSTVNKLWTETYKLNVLYKENWTAMAIKEIEHFQKELVKALKDGYAPGEENKVHSRWSFTDSWMYSISIITTIGKHH